MPAPAAARHGLLKSHHLRLYFLEAVDLIIGVVRNSNDMGLRLEMKKL